MKDFPRIFAACALALCPACNPAARADVRMPPIFGDHMVLQQDLPIPVWGTADPGESVAVTVGEHGGKATAGADGKWEVKLAPFAPGASPVTMTVAGKNTLKFDDVLIGEVWVCSGQSNMALPLAKALDGPAEAAKAGDPQLRFFSMKHRMAHIPVADLEGKWELCAPDTVAGFPAVGYFFGKELKARLHRPMGLIAMHYGGSSAVAWVSIDGLRKEPSLQHYVKTWRHIDATYDKALADYPAAMRSYDAALQAWNGQYGQEFTAALDHWQKQVAQAVETGQPLPPRVTPPAPMPRKPDAPAGDEFCPATLYDGMVAPLEPYAMRGVIWYQGESNARRPAEYHTLFSRLITDWRENWGEGDFPFLFVQLAGYRADDSDSWPQVREAQLQTLALPNTGMASAVDIGDPGNLHPIDKRDVGKRLALAARHVAYGEDVVCSGPLFKALKKEGAALRVEFADTGSGLEIGKPPWVAPHAAELPVDRLVGFEVAGADGQWKPADAKIDGNAIVVMSAGAPDPVAVRYAWKEYPAANLYNKEGLPASPFRAETKPQ